MHPPVVPIQANLGLQYIKSPAIGDNQYDCRLRDDDPTTKTLFVLRQEGNLYERIRGAESLYLTAAFVFTRKVRPKGGTTGLIDT
jgi:hypothetical protein